MLPIIGNFYELLSLTNPFTKMAQVSFGSQIREFRRRMNKTQAEFAEDLNTTQAHISQIENEEILPTGNFLKNLAERFPEINYNWLFFGEGSHSRKEEDARLFAEARKKVEKEASKSFDEINRKIAKMQIEQNKLLKAVAPKRKR